MCLEDSPELRRDDLSVRVGVDIAEELGGVLPLKALRSRARLAVVSVRGLDLAGFSAHAGSNERVIKKYERVRGERTRRAARRGPRLD